MQIQGNGFILRRWMDQDTVPLQKYADNTNISDFLLDRFPSPYTMDDAINWVKLMQSQDPLLIFVIDVKGEFSGVVGLEARDDVYRKTALLGYWIRQEYWGRGIMPQAVKLIVNYAFGQLGFLRVQAGILSNNPKSMRVLEKAGFQKEGILKSSIIKKGTVLDEHVYGLVSGS